MQSPGDELRRVRMTDRRRGWVPVLAPGRARMAIDVAREVADRLREPRRVEAVASAARQQTSHPEVLHWESHGVAQGFAGLALLWGYLDGCFPNEGWDAVAYEHLRWASQSAEEGPLPSPGVFGGLSGLGFAGWYLSHAGRRYQRLMAGVERLLLPQVDTLDDLGECPGGGGVGYFDVISGLAGIGAYLLGRRERPECAAALNVVLRRLVELTAEDDGVPRWHTPPEFLTDDSRAQFPAGNLNCGLAHGIPGPLALLALAVLHDVHVDGIADALDRTAGWLCRHRADDDWGVNWPYAVPLGEPGARPGAGGSIGVAVERRLPPSRAAWCYGSPGVARALWLAGEALGDTRYRDLAASGMEAVLRKPIEHRAIDSATFCHGVAGLAQVTLRFAHDTALPHLAREASELIEQLLGLYAPDRPLGYCSLDTDGVAIDNPGLLDGAPGVALVLLAAATDVEPAWDRLFLLS